MTGVRAEAAAVRMDGIADMTATEAAAVQMDGTADVTVIKTAAVLADGTAGMAVMTAVGVTGVMAGVSGVRIKRIWKQF
ncbi:MAG: hypothetical protein QM657_12575 [Lacrimispora sp.]|uniref:hypothetical protein n=1 Tax=Lacrimispora sp. TaxID=2719234 RepID=UPI0039E66AA4